MLSIFRINLQTVQRKLYREEFNLYRRAQKRYLLSGIEGTVSKIEKKTVTDSQRECSPAQK